MQVFSRCIAQNTRDSNPKDSGWVSTRQLLASLIYKWPKAQRFNQFIVSRQTKIDSSILRGCVVNDNVVISLFSFKRTLLLILRKKGGWEWGKIVHPSPQYLYIPCIGLGTTLTVTSTTIYLRKKFSVIILLLVICFFQLGYDSVSFLS